MILLLNDILFKITSIFFNLSAIDIKYKLAICFYSKGQVISKKLTSSERIEKAQLRLV